MSYHIYMKVMNYMDRFCPALSFDSVFTNILRGKRSLRNWNITSKWTNPSEDNAFQRFTTSCKKKKENPAKSHRLVLCSVRRNAIFVITMSRTNKKERRMNCVELKAK